MDTSIALSQGRRRRRIHSAEFKAHIVAACCKPGVSSAAVAMANGINANLVRRWVKEAEIGTEVGLGSTAGQPETTKPPAPAGPKFLPLSLTNAVSAIRSRQVESCGSGARRASSTYVVPAVVPALIGSTQNATSTCGTTTTPPLTVQGVSRDAFRLRPDAYSGLTDHLCRC